MEILSLTPSDTTHATTARGLTTHAPTETGQRSFTAPASTRLLPLLRDGRSDDPERAPLALGRLLDAAAPQVGRIVTIWTAGLPAERRGDPDLLAQEAQLHVATRLERCRARTEDELRAWVSVVTFAFLSGSSADAALASTPALVTGQEAAAARRATA
jgi:hypothetical protein